MNHRLVFPGLFFVLLVTSLVRAISLETYTSQTQIDTLVLNAVYQMDEAATFEGMESRRRAAISNAREVVNKLRKMAEGGTNRNYILWKASELESQVFLEENGLLMEEAQRKQKQVQGLIDQFNATIGKKRPNFLELQKIYTQMVALDPKKSNELIYPMTDRQRNISREVIMAIEAALAKNNLDGARADLDYCEDMQGRLSIPAQKLKDLRTQLQSRLSVAEERAYLARSRRIADSLLLVGMLGAAQDTLQRMRRRLEGNKGVFPTSEWELMSKAVMANLAASVIREDSLVEAGMRILSTTGIFAAVEYKEKLKILGVDPVRLARIEKEIVTAAVSRQNTRDEKIGKALDKLVNDDQTDAFGVGSLAEAAKKKAQQRADSIQAEQERQKLAAMSRRERRKYLREKQTRQLQAATTTPESESIVVNNEVLAIYGLIEQGRVDEAYGRFNKEKQRYKTYLCKEAFDMLQTTLDQSYAFAKESK